MGDIKKLIMLLRVSITVIVVFFSVSVMAKIDREDWKLYTSDAQSVLELIEAIDSGDPEKDLEHVKYTEYFSYQEVFDALIERMRKILVEFKDYKEPFKVTNIPMELKVFGHCTKAIGHIGTFDQIEEFEDLILETVSIFDDNAPVFTQAISKVAAAATEHMAGRHVTLPKLGRVDPDIVILGDRSSRTPKSHDEFMRKYLEGRIIGQPEAIDAFLDIEQQNLIFGSREKPVVLMLMGAPGTGKDTSVEAYVDAMYDKEGAHVDHMFRLPVMKNKADSWGTLGSATGYVGSDQFPPFLEFLVKHSGGRYLIEEKKDERGRAEQFVVQNPEWKGENLPGYFTPESAVVFINEFHNWSKEIKDLIIKQAIEKGYFQVNNPKGGVAQLYVPVTFVMATNEGLGLVTSRESNGQRFGKPLTYNEMMEKWSLHHNDMDALRTEIKKTNGKSNGGISGESSPGISEELLNRIPDRGLVLLRPLSPDSLKEIAKIKLAGLKKRFAKASGKYGKLQLSWTDKVVDFIQEYHYQAEENARPIEDRVVNLIESTILHAFREEKLEADGEEKSLLVDVIQKADGTYELEFNVEKQGKKAKKFSLDIRATEFDRKKEPISDARVDELFGLADELKKRVFGVSHVLDRLGVAVLDSEEGRQGVKNNSEATEPARSFMFLGLSSTGKTETAKQLANSLYGSEDSLITMDFSQVRSVQDLKEKILGTRDSLNNPVPSDFMKHYDRTQGKIVVVLDEAANAPKEALKALYDIFREPVVSTFSDGKERVMSNVTIVLTGNAGEEWYQGIPDDISDEMRRSAMHEIYEEMMGDPEARRSTLEKYFSEAFINRIGEKNIFFYPPLDFKAVRELTQLKLNLAVKRIKAKEGRRGWNIFFNDAQSYIDLVSAIEKESFIIREQGASIDRFIKQDFEGNLRRLMLKHKVPSDSKIIVSFKERIEGTEETKKRGLLVFSVETETNGTLELVIKGKEDITPTKRSKFDQIQTAFHEAGHELVRKAFFDDITTPKQIKIIPGVTMIADRWVVYDGIARREIDTQRSYDRNRILREMAILFGGDVAQNLVTKGGRTFAGKSNDMERASSIAERSILKFGLSEAWGYSVHEKSELSDAQKDLLKVEVDKMLNEARELARRALLVNYDSLIAMGNELAKKGELKEKDFERFYGENKTLTEADAEFSKFGKTWVGHALKVRVNEATKRFRKDVAEPEFMKHVVRPNDENVADIENLIEIERQRQIEGVEILEGTPLINCELALTGK